MKHKWTKQSLALVLCGLLLTGCGAGAPAAESESVAAETTASSEVEESTTVAESTVAAETEETAGTEEATASIPTKGIKERTDEMRDITPMELVSEMTTGWNLGNTFDAFGTSGVAAETSWGNPTTTKEMIDAVCEAGFDSIRIPVTWADHMGPAPDYTVDEAWMARVEEVINYALDDGMYVILNSHHEEEWRIPDDAHIDAVDAQVGVLWTQIAEHFKDYGDHLIFEGLNEPRVKGGQNEWSGGTTETRKCLDRLNQTFVDSVRATGGNNDKRLLLITSYASSHVVPTIGCLQIPEDDHIAVSIHAYTPYYFTYSGTDGSFYDTWDGSHRGDIDGVMRDLKRVFIDKGIPVLLTEYGAEDKNGNTADVCTWVTYYLTKAKELNMPCFWWDNGLFEDGNEHFAIFNRRDLSWYRQDVVDAIMSVYYE